MRHNLFTIKSVLIMLVVLSISVPTLFAQGKINMYGYFSVNYEQDSKYPNGTKPPGKFTYPHMNLMMQSSLSDNFRVYVNMAGDGANEISLRNFWGEYTLKDYFKIRVGKVYRPFGLYNEKLDAVPTYLGIEPPELFDEDHLLVPRTSELMLHGKIPFGSKTFGYAFMTGNKELIEHGKSGSWDFNLDFSNKFKIGTSGYYSNEKGSPKEIGQGSPDGSVLPWMASDKNLAYGGYMQSKIKNLSIEAAYWMADHDATRDAERVASLFGRTYLTPNNMSRFGLDKYAVTGDIASINTDGDYKVKTWYVRAGYRIPGGTIDRIKWDIIPYAFWDYYENPETIYFKQYGGDGEAGGSDKGKLSHPTIGVVLKPSYKVAIKLDYSGSMTEVYGDKVNVKTFRCDVSFFFN